MRIKHTLFVEYQDTSKCGGKVCVSDTKNYAKKQAQANTVNDIALIPIELDLRIAANLT